MTPNRRTTRLATAAPLVALASLFALLAFDVSAGGWSASLDSSVAGWVSLNRHPFLTPLMRSATTLGGMATMAGATTIACAAFVLRGRSVLALRFGLLMITGATASHIAKTVFERVRPEAADALTMLPDSFAFPSGHAISSALFFGGLWVVLVTWDARPRAGRLAAAVASACVVLVGLSRVYLGVHRLTDVFAGWVLAAVLLVAAWRWLASADGAVAPSSTTGRHGDL